MTIVRRTTPPTPSSARRRSPLALATVALLGIAALGLTSCSTSASATVTLRRAEPGQVSALVAHRFDESAATQEIRFTSGTGKSIEVRPYDFENGNFLATVAPTTVLDSGPSGPWTTVAPGFTFGTTPQDLALRLTTTGTADLALTYEIRGVDQSGQPTSGTSSIPATGPDCAKAPPYTDLGSVDLSGLSLQGCFMAGVTLDPTKVTGTKLAAADLSQATILPGAVSNTDLTFARLGHSALAQVDLRLGFVTDASFAHASLDHAVLRNVHLDRTDLTGTNLTGADLTGAVLLGSTGTPLYAGATFNGTTCPDGTSSTAHGQTCQGHPWP